MGRECLKEVGYGVRATLVRINGSFYLTQACSMSTQRVLLAFLVAYIPFVTSYCQGNHNLH